MTEIQFAKQFLTTSDNKPSKYQPGHVFNRESFQIRVPYTLPKLSHPPHPLPPKPASQQSKSQTNIPSNKRINVTLKSGRNPVFTLHLPSLPSSTPFSTIRAQVQTLLSEENTPIPLDKIKVLFNKKPIPPSKPTVHDVIGSGDDVQDAEFGLMIMGGAPEPKEAVQTVHLGEDATDSNVDMAETDARTDVGPGSEKAMAELSETVEQPGVPAATASNGESSSRQVSSDSLQPGEVDGQEMLKTEEFWDDLQGFLAQRLKSGETAKKLRDVFEEAASTI